jgi:hypothetical protein
MNVFIGFSCKAIDKFVFMWIMQITNLGWVQLFFSHLDNSRREPIKSGSHNIHTVRFYYIISE